MLVDISPDVSLWPRNDVKTCINTEKEHEHLPIWPKSVIIVCEEVDTLAPEYPSAVAEYRLRRVTTLEWECRKLDKPEGCWLPFKPYLEHMRSVVCSVKSRKFLKSLDNKGIDSPDNEGIDIDSPDNEGMDIDSSDNEGMDIDSSGIDLNVFCDPVAVANLLSQEGWHDDWPQGWSSRWPRYQVYVI